MYIDVYVNSNVALQTVKTTVPQSHMNRCQYKYM